MVPPHAGVDAIHAELEHTRTEVRELVRASCTPAGLARRWSGTRWSNRELLFHILFGYLITRNLRIIVKIVCRLPDRAQHRFAAALDTAGVNVIDRDPATQRRRHDLLIPRSFAT